MVAEGEPLWMNWKRWKKPREDSGWMISAGDTLQIHSTILIYNSIAVTVNSIIYPNRESPKVNRKTTARYILSCPSSFFMSR